jgi:cytoskeletal protein CcmA (bactofilin family)
MFRREKPGELQTIIGPAVTVHGDVTWSGGLHVEGRVLGRLCLAPGHEGNLSVASPALIDGDVEATHANLDGRVRGDVRVSGSLALGPRAVIEGNVRYGSIEMAAGARIIGKMLSGGPAASAAGPSPDETLESSR